jgi:hypothetical protein
VLAACKAAELSPVGAPGTTLACRCADGAFGEATYLVDQSGFDACACDGTSSSGASSSSSASSSSAAGGGTGCPAASRSAIKMASTAVAEAVTRSIAFAAPADGRRDDGATEGQASLNAGGLATIGPIPPGSASDRIGRQRRGPGRLACSAPTHRRETSSRRSHCCCRTGFGPRARNGTSRRACRRRGRRRP